MPLTAHRHVLKTKPYSNGLTDSRYITVCTVCDAAGLPQVGHAEARSSFINLRGYCTNSWETDRSLRLKQLYERDRPSDDQLFAWCRKVNKQLGYKQAETAYQMIKTYKLRGY